MMMHALQPSLRGVSALGFEQGHNEAIQSFDLAKSKAGLLRRGSPSKAKGFAARNDEHNQRSLIGGRA